MTERPALRLQFLVALLTSAMLVALLMSLAGFWRQHFPAPTVLLVALGCGALGWLGWQRPWVLTAGLAAAVAGALVLPFLNSYLTFRWHINVLAPAADQVVELLRKLFELYSAVRVGKFETWDPTVAWFFLGLSGMASALAITWEALSRGDTFWSLVAGAGLFGFQWVLFWDEAEPYLVAYMGLGLILWALAHAAHRTLRWRAEGRRAIHLPHWGSGVGVVILVTFTAGLLPSGWQPVDLGATAERLREVWPGLQKLRGAGVGGGGRATRFDLRQIGFGGDTEFLGGPVYLDDGVALRLQLEEPVPGASLYLRGSVHTRYTGRGWLGPDLEAPRTVPANTVLPTAFSALVPKLYIKGKITPVNLRTETLFHLLEPVSVEGVRNYRADGDANVLAPSPRAPNQPYVFQSRVGRTSSAQIREISRGTGFAASDPPAELAPYLELPPLGRDGALISRLARQVVARATHPLDQALAIESFLRTNYRYNLRVPMPPRNRDFVAHFLLAQREGYCTYFSTAMVVLLRELGIPARWVQGFALTPGSNTAVEIKNAQAHAWVEAYFEGYGWVTFDPTPRSDLPPLDRSYVVPPEEPAANLTDDDELELRGSGSLDLEPEDDFGAGDAPGTAVAGWTRLWPLAGLGLGALLALALAAWTLLRLQTKVHWANEAVAIQELYALVAQLMGQFGYGPRPEMTPREYAAALGRAWPHLGDLANRVADAYALARYGPPVAAQPGGGQIARQLLLRSRAALVERFGRTYYAWRRLTVLRSRSHMLEIAEIRSRLAPRPLPASGRH